MAVQIQKDIGSSWLKKDNYAEKTHETQNTTSNVTVVVLPILVILLLFSMVLPSVFSTGFFSLHLTYCLYSV